MRRRTILGTLLAAPAVLAACGPYLGAAPVDVDIVDLLPAPTGQGQGWRAVLDLTNRGATDIPVRAMDVDIRLDGSDLGRGRIDRPFLLAAGRTERVEVPLQGTWLGLAQQIVNLASDPDFAWELRGTLVTDGTGGAGTLPLYSRGRLLGGRGGGLLTW